MNDHDKKLIVVGTFGQSYGIHGWVKVNSDTDPCTAVIDYQPWQTETAQGWQPVRISEIKPYNNQLIALLPDYPSREAVATLSGKAIAVFRSQLPKAAATEVYWTDLEGLPVFTSTGIELGKVDHLFATGSNDVLVVAGEKRHLIPYLLNQTVIKVDLAQQQIIVDWDPEF